MKLFRKKSVLWPTPVGLAVFSSLLFLLLLGLLAGLYPFLAQNHPHPNAEILILEGWMGDAELTAAVSVAASNTLFVASGGPVEYGVLLFKEKTFADMTASRLLKLGVPASRILSAPAPDTKLNRTYIAALAVRDNMEQAGLLGRPANLVSVGVHSRRSGFLYRRAFGSEAPLGLVSLECARYDQRRWWRSSEAFKAVVTEMLSWIYVQCCRWKYDGGRSGFGVQSSLPELEEPLSGTVNCKP